MREIIITFDFDGTLFLSNEIKKNTFFEVIREFKGGLNLMQNILKNKNLNRYEIFKIFSNELNTKSNQEFSEEKFAEDYSLKCFKKIVEESREREGKKELFEFLKLINSKCFLISATPINDLVKITDTLKISGDFIKIYGSPTTKEIALLEIIKTYLINNNRIIHVGDGLDDYNAAKNTGCKFIGVEGNGLENIKGLKLIKNLKEIITIIKKIT